MSTLRVGQSLRFRSDHLGAFMKVEGFTDLAAKPDYYRQPAGMDDEEWKQYLDNANEADEQVFQLVSVCEFPPARLYTGSSTFTGDPANRIDLEMQKMAALPRLFSSELGKLEDLWKFKKMKLKDLAMMQERLLESDPRIGGLLCAFEAGYFKRPADVAQYMLPTSHDDDEEPQTDWFGKKKKKKRNYNVIMYHADKPNYRSEDWYRRPKFLKKAVWTGPTIDSVVGTVPVISYSVPITAEIPSEHADRPAQVKFIGVVRMDIRLDLESSRPQDDPASRPIEQKQEESLDEDTERLLVEMKLQDISGEPSISAEMMETVRRDELLEDGWFKNFFQNVLANENRSILGAVIAFRKDIHPAKMCLREKNFDIQQIIELKEDVTKEQWFIQTAKEQRAAMWMRDPLPIPKEYRRLLIVDEAEIDDACMISYCAPFEMEGEEGIAGVIRLDLHYDFGVIRSSTTFENEVEQVICASCAVECPKCYYKNTFSLTKTAVCLRCFVDNMIPPGTSADEYTKVMSDEYREWLDRYRKPSNVSYGDVVQLLHSKSGKFLMVGLGAARDEESDEPRSYYKLQVENDVETTDPYLEGGESTWFTLMPSTDVRSEGELISAGDQVRLVSYRWQWEAGLGENDVHTDELMHEMFEETKDDDGLETRDDVVKWEANRHQGRQWSLSSGKNWKVVPHQSISDQMIEEAMEAKARIEARESGQELRTPEAQVKEDESEDEGEDKHDQVTDLGILDTPSSNSPFLRDGDLIFIRAATSAQVMALSSVFNEYQDGESMAMANKNSEDVYVHYGRVSFELNMDDDDSLQGVWQVEIAEAARDSKLGLPLDDLVTWSTIIRLKNCLNGRYMYRGEDTGDKEWADAKQGSYVFPCASVECSNPLDLEEVDCAFQLVPFTQQGMATPDANDIITTDQAFYIRLVTRYELNEHRLMRRQRENDADMTAQLVTSDPEYIDPYGLRSRVIDLSKFKKENETYWVNVGEEGVAFTSYRDEEDTFNAVKVKMGYQKAIYMAAQALRVLDGFIADLYKSWDELGHTIDTDADTLHSRVRNGEYDWIHDFILKRYSAMIRNRRIIRELGRFCALAYNNSDVDMTSVINDPRHQEPGESGLVAAWRQMILFEENVIERVYAILQHPMYHVLVHFRSARTELDKDEESERRDVAIGLTSKKEQSRDEEKKVTEAEHQQDIRNKHRETALDVFRSSTELLSMLVIDFPTAAIHSSGIRRTKSVISETRKSMLVRMTSANDIRMEALKRWDPLSFVLEFLPFSTPHNLGLQTFLALLFENGRDRLATLTLNGDQLNRLFVTWSDIQRRRKDLKVKHDREANSDRHRGDHAYWRRIAKQDSELSASATDFLRIMYSLCECDGIAHQPNQLSLLSSIAREAERLEHQGDIAESVVSNTIDNTFVPDSDDDQDDFEPPQLLDTRSSVLGFLVAICKDSARMERAGEEIVEVTEALQKVLGVDQLDFSFEQILECMRDDDRPIDLRARYVQLLHQIYVDREVPRRLIDYTPYIPQPQWEADDEKSADGRMMPQRMRAPSSVNALREISVSQGRDVWDFLFDYLMQCGTKPEQNTLTLAMIKMANTLVQLEYPADPEDEDLVKSGKAKALGGGQVGPSTQLNQLVTTLIPLLKVKQRRSDTMGQDDWARFSRELVLVKTEICKLLDVLFDYRLSQRLSVFLSLRTISFSFGKSGGEVEPVFPVTGRARQSSMDDIRELNRDDGSIELLERVQNRKVPERISGAKNIEHFLETEVFSERNDILSADVRAERRLEQVLLGLVEDGEETDLVLSAFGLLQRQYKQASELITAAKKVIVLDSEDVSNRAMDIYQAKWQLRYMVEVELASESELDIDIDSLHAKSSSITYIIEKFRKHFFDQIEAEDGLPLDMTTIFVQSGSFSDVGIAGLNDRKIRFLPKYKILQDVFRMYSIHEDLIDILRMPIPPSSMSSFMRDMMLACYDVLILWVDGNSKNMKKLELHLPLFWSQKHLGAQPTMLLTRMLGGNLELCERIPTSFLEDYLHFLASPEGKSRNSWTRTVVPIQFLKAIVRVNRRIIPRIQQLVVKSICESPFILGYLAHLEKPDQMRKLVDILNFELTGDATEPLTQRALMNKQYYLEIISLLTRAAPCRYIYVNDVAKRESAESAMLIQTAINVRHIINLMCEVTEPAADIPMLRFFEQVYSTQLSKVHPRDVTRLISNLRRDVLLLVSDWEKLYGNLVEKKPKSVDHETDVHSPAMSDVSTENLIPITDNNVEPSSSEMVLFKSRSRTATAVSTRSRRQSVAGHDHREVSPMFISYVFEVLMPFVVAYYHSSFKLQTASKEETLISDKLFDSIADLAALAMARDKVIEHKEGDEERQEILRTHTYMARSSLAAEHSKKPGFGVKVCLGALISMYDPTGEGLNLDSKPRGIKGTGRWPQDSIKQLLFRMRSRVEKTSNRRNSLAVANELMQLSSTAPHLVKMRDDVAQTHSQKVMNWVRHMIRGLRKRESDENNDFHEWWNTNSRNVNLLRKAVLLIGEFAQSEEDPETASHWINDNSSKFVVAYLGMLRGLIKPDEDEDPRDLVRHLLVDIGLPRILINLLSVSQSVKVQKAALALCNTLLEDGFRPAQRAFYREQLSLGSNRFFLRIRDILASPLKIITLDEQMTTGRGEIPERYGSWDLIARSLNLLQLFCEGHNVQWQQFLNNQKLGLLTNDEDSQDDFGVSVNLVAKSVDLLSSLVDKHGPLWYVIVYWLQWYDEDTVSKVLGTTDQLIDALTEVTQGPCVENQVELTKGRFLQSVNWLLDAMVVAEEANVNNLEGYGRFDENRTETYLEIQSSLLATLMAMLEGHVPSLIPRRMVNVLNFSLMYRLMEIYLAQTEEPAGFDYVRNACYPVDVTKDSKNEPINVVLDYYIFIRTLLSEWERAETGDPLPKELSLLVQSSVFHDCDERFGDKVGKVEILRNDRLEVALFRIPAVVQSQAKTASFKELKQSLIYSVRRDNQHAKIDDFLNQANDELVFELVSFPRMKKHWIVKGYPLFRDMTWWLAIVQNIVSVITNDDRRGDKWGAAMTLFGVVQTFFALFRFTSFAFSHAPLVYHRWKPDEANNTAARLSRWITISDEEDELSTFNPMKLVGGLSNLGKQAAKTTLSILSSMVELAKFSFVFLMNPLTLYQLLYISASILGIFYPVFYVYLLLDIIGRSPLLREVFSALVDYLPTLGSTALLWFILMYGFAAVGYFAFQEDFVQDGESVCGSKAECVMHVLTKGLQAGGGIADVIEGVQYNTTKYWWRSIYDDLYFLVLVIVMLAIVSGIIIDAFGASRDHRHEVEDDQQNVCFICGHESSKFDQKRGFEFHVEHEHNMWNYVYFLAYLQTKDPNDYTGQESYVSSQIEDNQISWIPIERSIMLETDEDAGKH